jgi:hypothetical protein
MLGPSQAGNNAGGSSGDSLKLQSAGTSPLQSQASDSNGLTAPNSSVLQAPANSDQALRVLAGEADGSPVQLSDSTGLSAWAWFGMPLLLALIVAGAAYFLRRHPQLHRPLTRHLPKPNLRLPRLPIRKSRG